MVLCGVVCMLTGLGTGGETRGGKPAGMCMWTGLETGGETRCGKPAGVPRLSV
jgi:hypothetical protein